MGRTVTTVGGLHTASWFERMSIVRQTPKLQSESPTVAITPATPANVTATLEGGSGITVTWTDGGNDVALAGYRVYRATDAATYTLQGSATTLTYTQLGLAPATYTYRVTAYSAAGVESGAGTSNGVTIAEDDVLEWTIPDVAGVDLTLPATTAGQAQNLLQYVNVPAGATPYFTITAITAANGSATTTLSVSESSGVLSTTANTPADVYDVTVNLAGSAEASWLTRSRGAGVLWAHDFREDWEVNYFRWRTGSDMDPTGTYDPGGVQETGASVHRLATDGITGSCLEISEGVGKSTNWMWYRPLSPLAYAGALNPGNVIPPDQGWSAGMHSTDPYNAQGRKASSWQWGYVAHPTSEATLGTNDGEARYARSELYVQFGVKISAGHTVAGGNTNPKLFYFDQVGGDTGDECVGQFQRRSDTVSRFSMYTNQGSLGDGSSAMLKDPMGHRTRFSPVVASESVQYQTDDYVTCVSVPWNSTTTIANNCWVPPLDEWFTVMFRIAPGPKVEDIATPAGNNPDGVPYSTFDVGAGYTPGTSDVPVADGILKPIEQYYAKYPNTWTTLEMWVYQRGWAGFRKVFSSDNLFFNWSGDYGWNALKFTLYSEPATGIVAVVPQYHRFCQVIASTQPIPAPVYE